MSKFSLYLNIKGINKTSGPCENQKFYLVNIKGLPTSLQTYIVNRKLVFVIIFELSFV